MDSLVVRIMVFCLGAFLVVFNKPLAKLTGRWQATVFGHEFGEWTNRIPCIIVGILTMVVSFVSAM